MQMKRGILFQAVFVFVVMVAGVKLGTIGPDFGGWASAPHTFFPYFLGIVLGGDPYSIRDGNPRLSYMVGYVLGSALEWGLIGYWLSIPFAMIFAIRGWQKSMRAAGGDESDNGEGQPVTGTNAGNPPQSRVHGLRPGVDVAQFVWLTVIKRQRLVITLAAGLTVAVAGGAAYGWSHWSAFGPVVSGPGYEGVLMVPEQLRPEGGLWQPSLGQVREMEAELVGYVDSRKEDFGSKVVERIPH